MVPRTTSRSVRFLSLVGLIGALGIGPAIAQEAPADPPAGDDVYLLAKDVDDNLPVLAEVQSSGKLQEHLKSYGNLRLSDEARVVNNTLIEDGVCRAVFDKGILVPVESGKGEVPSRTVGFVFFGKGRLSVKMDDRADATRFANHMVSNAGRTADEMRPIAHQEVPYETTFERAFVLTADRQMEDVVRRLNPIGGGMVTTEAFIDDETREIVEEYVVTESRGETKAKFLARQIFPDRSRVLRASGIDTVDMVQYDRMVHDLLGEPWRNLRMIAEFQTADRFFVANKQKVVSAPEDQWLTCFRDGFDHRGNGRYSTTFVHGLDRDGQLQLVEFAGERFHPRPADGVPVPDQRIEAVFGKAVVDLRPYKRMMYIRPKVRNEITLRATDDGVRHVLLRLPREEAIQGSFKVTKLETLDGRAVDFMELDALQSRMFGVDTTNGDTNAAVGQGQSFATGGDTNLNAQSENLTEPQGVPQELLVVLPDVLRTKDEVTLVVEWEATWNHGAWQLVQGDQEGSSQSNAFRPAGASTGPKQFLPELLPQTGGTAWDFQVEVGVPPRRIEAAMSGDTSRSRIDEAGWVWVTSKGRDMRKPSVAAGQWKSVSEPSAAGLPGINVHLFSTYASALDQFGPEVRRILIFLRRFMELPRFYELDVYQGRTELMEDVFSRPVDQAAGGMVGIKTIRVGERVTSRSQLTDENPFRAQSDLAQQMTTQVWGQVVTPASNRDAWMIQAISDAFGMFYVRSAMAEDGFNAFEQRLEYVRDQLEDPRETIERAGQVSVQDRFLSLTEGGSLARTRPRVFNDYGFYVIARMLRERIGDLAFFRALDQFSSKYQGRLVTTEQLQEAFELSSGQDLDAFFAYWIRGGFVPKVVLEYSLQPEPGGTFTVDGCITTDIPFGQFDMPVAILDQKGERGVGGMIDVVDGRGRFSVEGRAADVELEADPYGLILSYGRKVKKVDETTCAREGGNRWSLPADGTIDRDADPDVDYDRTGETTPLPPGGELPPLEDGRKRRK